MKYFISAGEASGDLHASHLMAGLRDFDREARFVFLGGDLMAEVSGTAPLIHYRRMAYMGFSEVIRHLPEVTGALRRAKAALREERPDALIAVDYPSFNLRLAREAVKLGIPVYWFIAPKVWAWKEWRVKDLRRLCRRVLSILPFEKEWFATRGVEVDYVGNPSVDETDRQLASCRTREEIIADHDITHRPLLLLVPGSREAEIRNNLPVMTSVARRRRDMQAVVAAAPGSAPEIYRRHTTLPLIDNSTLELMAHADAALVTSGTATLECALAGTPQVVMYRANGSRISYGLMKRLLHIDHVSLPNLIAGRTVVPEKLLHHCTPAEVSEALDSIVSGGKGRESQLAGYIEMRRRLGSGDAAVNAARIITKDLIQHS